MVEIRNVYQWGVLTYTIENPNIQTLNNYLNEHSGIFTPLTEENAYGYLQTFKAKQRPNLEFFIGTQTEFEKYRADLPVITKAEEGQASLEVSSLIATLAAYATEFKNGKVVQILTVLNQVGRAIFDKVENETTVNQNYEVLLHSMLIEMYSNHRELYTALFAEEKIEEVYETKVVVDFFKVIFANKYITT